MKTSRKLLSAASAVLFVLGIFVYYNLQFSTAAHKLLPIASPFLKYFFGIAFFTLISLAGIITLSPALKNRYSFALLIVPTFQRVIFLLLDLLGALACYNPSNPAPVNFLSEAYTPFRRLMLAGFVVNFALLLGIILWKRFLRKAPAFAENV